MQQPDSSSGLGYGAVYAMQDRLGLLRRMFIIVIDLIVILIAWYGLATLIAAKSLPVFFCSWVGISFAYLVVLKTYGRTLGYFLTDAKLVDIRGERPGLFRVLFRLLLANASNPLLDPIWFGLGKKRTLRDLLAGTYVVKDSAKPLGKGEIRHSYLFALSYSFMYREVVDGGASKLQFQEPTAKS